MEFDPALGQGLQGLLNDTTENLKDTLYMNFTYEYESCWGEKKIVELKDGGSNIFVD